MELEVKNEESKTNLQLCLIFVAIRFIMILISFRLKGENREIVHISYKVWFILLVMYISLWVYISNKESEAIRAEDKLKRVLARMMKKK